MCDLFNDRRAECIEEQEREQSVGVSSEISDVCKRLAIPLQAWTDCTGLKLPEFLDIRHVEAVRMSALRTRRLYPTGDTAGTHFCQRLSHPLRRSAAGSQ
jgi:hypothetical protein